MCSIVLGFLNLQICSFLDSTNMHDSASALLENLMTNVGKIYLHQPHVNCSAVSQRKKRGMFKKQIDFSYKSPLASYMCMRACACVHVRMYVMLCVDRCQQSAGTT